MNFIGLKCWRIHNILFIFTIWGVVRQKEAEKSLQVTEIEVRLRTVSRETLSFHASGSYRYLPSLCWCLQCCFPNNNVFFFPHNMFGNQCQLKGNCKEYLIISNNKTKKIFSCCSTSSYLKAFLNVFSVSCLWFRTELFCYRLKGGRTSSKQPDYLQ